MKLSEYLKPRGQTKTLSLAIEVPAALMSQWGLGVRQVPAERCPDIEFSTSGQVTCEELRPDLCWVRVPDKKWPNKAGRPLVDHYAKRKAA